MAGFLDRRTLFSRNNKNIVTSTIKKLSSFGMQFDDMVLVNSRAIGTIEDEFGWRMDPANVSGGSYGDYDLFANLASADTINRKSISFFDKNYQKKRQELREFSIQDEIEEILDTLCDESIVFDSKNYFCQAEILDDQGIKPENLSQIKSSMVSSFKKLYQYFGFNNDISAWSFFRKWLVDGYLAFEIIYDKRQKNIIGFKELDPISLQPGIKDGKKIWYQFKDQPNKERMLWDAQVIYLSYSNMGSVSRVSYVERLIRAFNVLRIMEHTRVIWAVVNSSYKTKFIIPVAGKSKSRAKQALGILMQQYRENIEFNTKSGELMVNGKAQLPFSKEYWIPEGDSGTPQIENIGNDGPDLSDTEALKYFREKLIKVSKIPLSRFDMESPPSWELNAESTTRDEIKFGRFVNRLRSGFKEILTKPLWIQMCLDHPVLKEDDAFKAQIAISFNKDNFFEQMKELEVMTKTANSISELKDSLIDTDANMQEHKYFSSKFLIEKYKLLSQEETLLNDKYKKEEEKALKKAAEEGAEIQNKGLGGF